jgi:sterol 24-C-methyltransferase
VTNVVVIQTNFIFRAHVTGLNINEYQLERAKILNKRDGLEANCALMKGDFMNVQVPDNTFDAVYEIEATCHAPDKVPVYAEMYRILKPGSYFAGYEWCMTDKYDPNNELHKKVKYGIEIGNGLPPMPLASEFQDALRKVGFEIIELTDFGVTTQQNPIPWWDTLDGKLTLSGFRFTRIGRWLTAKFVATLESVGFAPKGSLEAALLLNRTANDLVDGGRLGIFSPTYFFLVRKPLDAKQ